MDHLKSALELLKIDWVELPNILKYCCYMVIVGFGLLFTDTTFQMPMLWLRSRPTGFFLILLFSFLIPVGYSAYTRLKRARYRHLYPMKKLGNNFYLNSEIDGSFIIIDNKKKEIRWVENAITAYDLGFFDSLWLNLLQRKEAAMQAANNGPLNLDDYKIGKSIRIRGKPSLVSQQTRE